MAMTLENIRDLTRVLLSETTASFYTNAEINNWINYGLDDFCNRTKILEDISTDSTVQYQADYDLPTDYTAIKQVEIIKGSTTYFVFPNTLREQFTGTQKITSNPPELATIWGDILRFQDRPSNAASTTTLSGALSSAGVTISIASSTVLPNSGRVKIDSEVIEYWNVDRDNDEIEVATRGVEGTTATSHLDAATVTLRDIWFYHNKRATALTADSDTPEIPAQFHQALAYYAGWLGRLKSRDYDLAAQLKQQYEQFVNDGFEWIKFRWRKGANRPL